MLCYNCKSEMKKTKKDYPYKESGLDNVVLKGISAYVCPSCGEVNPVIRNVLVVHRRLAQAIISKKSILSNREIIFLRKEMGIKAIDLARIMGVSKVTVSRWENGRERISSVADRLVRTLYRLKMLEEMCVLARPEVEKLKTRSVDVDKIKEVFDSSCSVMAQTEAIFKSIGRQVHEGRILIQKHV
jgi:putative zinc finger/helix-turn-helix YgiT family protein